MNEWALGDNGKLEMATAPVKMFLPRALRGITSNADIFPLPTFSTFFSVSS
jgi:hypothetical protein